MLISRLGSASLRTPPAAPRCLVHATRRRCYNRPADNGHVASVPEPRLRRSWLYVPASSDKMLAKSLQVTSDMIIYDLEDSVSPVPADKEAARLRLRHFLQQQQHALDPQRVAVRVNSVKTEFFKEDMSHILESSAVGTLVLPKVNSIEHLDYVSDLSRKLMPVNTRRELQLVASIESAKALWDIGSISRWESRYGQDVQLSALLPDNAIRLTVCADTGIIRTQSRRELLYARSRIVMAAKAHGLEAIDMVCVNYKDSEELKEESRDGRNLGFNGKQAIHPSQVDAIQSIYVPTEQEILRAAKIVHQLDGTGAVAIDGEMIDAPMLKQAEKVIRIAKAARLYIPDVRS
ncbi:Pyruvate/Phosphoenolpyruvate kinase-like domain-containing protein [Schizophyllum amplum]|uniref:Pyruvate/Phosphoenolpyruvate kinase-like domain-containing protein n=1 Tax=Schizophyllum amplum TaxID=97359 RepID=A0A550CGU4_9AGAR|nr:Pyruvate/Phosphoenolpyruvate kinase-like domain-containing protein [Auriculariopsis ampla]